MTFRGWPEDALHFYAGLEADNSRSYWLAHKATYDECVKAPFLELSALVAKEFGPLHVFRPNRDTRFSKDKTPYKTAAAVVTECSQNSSGTERPFSENRSKAAVVAIARTVARPSTVTARHALETLPERP